MKINLVLRRPMKFLSISILTSAALTGALKSAYGVTPIAAAAHKAVSTGGGHMHPNSIILWAIVLIVLGVVAYNLIRAGQAINDGQKRQIDNYTRENNSTR